MPSEESNPARLKLALELYGVAPANARPGTDSTDTIEVLLADDIWASARINSASPISIAENPDVIRDGAILTAVRVAHTPPFAARRNARGSELGAIAAMRSTWVTVALGGGCGIGAAGRTCALCQGRELTEHAGELWPVDEVVEAVRGAFDDGDAEFVHFVLGYFPGIDAGFAMLKPYLEAIDRHFDTIVAVTMHPPADLRTIDLAYAEGVDVICFNLEAASEEAMLRHFPGRARFYGRERYLKALSHAARIFPSGAVWSDLLIDLAPKAALQAAATELVAARVLPTFGTLALRGADDGALEAAAELAAVSFEAATRAGISLNWMRDISTSFTILDARYLVSGVPQFQSLIHQLSRNRLGALATRSLARLRRRLRVRRVRASFDSSRL
ncbi:MAG: hypothetical protein WAM05_19185 [Candidatus Binataceae bacterium]